MIYRPNFCCNCGEKIERSEWKLWTSGRFCELCETEHKVRDLGPKALAIAGILTAIVGVGSYLRGPQTIVDTDTKRSLAGKTSSSDVSKPANIIATRETPQQSQSSPGNSSANVQPEKASNAAKLADSRSKEQDEAVYYCGAMTKKGTPCSRRVKQRGERCWQHRGMQAMTSSEER